MHFNEDKYDRLNRVATGAAIVSAIGAVALLFGVALAVAIYLAGWRPSWSPPMTVALVVTGLGSVCCLGALHMQAPLHRRLMLIEQLTKRAKTALRATDGLLSPEGATISVTAAGAGDWHTITVSHGMVTRELLIGPRSIAISTTGHPLACEVEDYCEAVFSYLVRGDHAVLRREASKALGSATVVS